MSSVSSNPINTSRISGLASGMDIDAIVKDMMKAARIPLDQLQQQKQILLWQQEDYRNINTALYEFRSSLFDMKLTSAFSINAVTISNNSLASVKASGNTSEGTWQITVNQLASGVSKASTSALAAEKNSDGVTLSLFDQFTEFAARGFEADDKITLAINGTDLEFDLGKDNINSVVSKINNAGLGVTASYDSSLKRFFLNTAGTGSGAEINISSDTANFMAAGASDSILKLSITEGESYHGRNALVDFGDAAGLEFSGNSITVNGLAFDLISEGSAVVTVKRDIDAVVDSIRNFADSYNKMLSTLYGKVQEERDRDYAPLTDAQKEEMSEEEIKKWEAKARSGLLRNDTLLQNLISSIRTAMSGIIEGADQHYDTLSEIGITTGRYTENGKLIINEDRLREALAKDPDKVKQMFVKTGDDPEENGFVNRLYDLASSGIRYISDKAGSASSLSTVDESYIGKRLTDKKEAIEKWEKRLEDLEERYYAQFTAMETMINQMNIQSAWLAAQFAPGA